MGLSVVGCGRRADVSTSGVSTVRYMAIGMAAIQDTLPTTEVVAQSYWGRAGTLRNMHVYIKTNGRSTTSTIYLRVSAADTALAVAIGGGLTGWFSDTSHSVSVSAGNLVNLRMALGTGSGSLTLSRAPITCEFEDSGGTGIVYSAANRLSNSTISGTTAATLYDYPACQTAPGPNDTGNTRLRFRTAGTLSRLSINVRSNPRANAVPCVVYSGGVATAVTVSLVSGLTGQITDTTHTGTVVAGDDVQLRYSRPTDAGGGTLNIESVSLSFLSANDDIDIFLVDTFNQTADSAAANYIGLLGGGTLIATRAEVEMIIPYDCVLKNFRYVTSNGTLGGATVTVFLNGVATSLTAAFGNVGAGILVEDLVHTVNVFTGDKICVERGAHAGTSSNNNLTSVGVTLSVDTGPPPGYDNARRPIMASGM